MVRNNTAQRNGNSNFGAWGAQELSIISKASSSIDSSHWVAASITSISSPTTFHINRFLFALALHNRNIRYLPIRYVRRARIYSRLQGLSGTGFAGYVLYDLRAVAYLGWPTTVSSVYGIIIQRARAFWGGSFQHAALIPALRGCAAPDTAGFLT